MPTLRSHYVSIFLSSGTMLIVCMLLTACGGTAGAPPGVQESQPESAQTTASGSVVSEEAPLVHEQHDEEQKRTQSQESHHSHDEDMGATVALTPIVEGETLRVVATTTLVGDVVKVIGGDAIDLTVLLPVRADPHTFEPTPQDVAAIADANIVFSNGAGLEEFLQPLIESAGVGEEKVVAVSAGIALLEFAGEHTHNDEHTADEHADSAAADQYGEDEHTHSGGDPHVWFSPVNVIQWSDSIATALSTADPAHAETYAANADAYEAELAELDTWIMEEIAHIPENKRVLVTDHMIFGYFAERYGFKQIGAVIPGYGSAIQPSAQELAQLEEAIQAYDVPAIFVGTTVNPGLSERVATDTGIEMVTLYTDSLSEAEGPAATYLELMRYNTHAIVHALAD